MTVNPQTTLLCDMLGLTDPMAVAAGGDDDERSAAYQQMIAHQQHYGGTSSLHGCARASSLH